MITDAINKQLIRTFKDILFKLEAFSLPVTRKSDEAGLNTPSAGALALEQFSSVLCALSSVMDAFEVTYSDIPILWRETANHTRNKGSAEVGKSRGCKGRSS